MGTNVFESDLKVGKEERVVPVVRDGKKCTISWFGLHRSFLLQKCSRVARISLTQTIIGCNLSGETANS
jgi:hypothetical protein